MPHQRDLVSRPSPTKTGPKQNSFRCQFRDNTRNRVGILLPLDLPSLLSATTRCLSHSLPPYTGRPEGVRRAEVGHLYYRGWPPGCTTSGPYFGPLGCLRRLRNLVRVQTPLPEAV